jgi:hypothetical protein
VRQRLTVVADAPVDDLDISANQGGDERSVLGQLGDEDIGLREQLGGADRQETRVARAGTHEADVAEWAASLRCADLHGCRCGR